MKKIAFVIILFFAFANIHAQNYLISFLASGSTTSLDSIKVENLTQMTSLTIGSSDVLQLVNPVGIEHIDKKNEQISIYPNPTDGLAVLKFYAKESGIAKLSVCDLNGRTIFQTDKFINQNNHNFQIDGLNKGVYIFKIEGKNYSYSSKLVSLSNNEGKVCVDEILSEKFIKNSNPSKNINNTTIDMNYTSGDNLRFTGYSSNCFHILIDIPSSSKTMTFNFATTTPVLTTVSVNSITSNSATVNGSITSNGNCLITARGICYNTTSGPTAADNISTGGAGNGQFIANMTGLTPGLKYYIRSYATNNIGTSYGNEISFTTLTLLPIITSTNASLVTNSSAQCGGNISSSGSTPLIARGVCWGLNQNPTINDSTTNDGVDTGSYTSIISGLTPNTTYYVRSYATNSSGTSYGNQFSFTTIPLAIGQSYQGGIIAYILKQGDPGFIAGENHGLIAAPSDQSSNCIWAPSPTSYTGIIATAIGSGLANSNSIVSNYGNGNYAAKICVDLSLNGYNDWYLPSKSELNTLYLSRNLIGGFVSDNDYWSSSESNSINTWAHNFYDGNQVTEPKLTEIHVRAVRSF